MVDVIFISFIYRLFSNATSVSEYITSNNNKFN
jgi:hypothetical protein